MPSVVRVRRVVRETLDTFTLALEMPFKGTQDHRDRLRFEPGQFNMLYVFGVGEVPISISGDPARAQSLVHTIRAVGYVTKAMSGLRRGDSIGLRGPFGRPWPIGAAAGQDVVIVAGGIGLAPLRPALYHILKHRADFGRIVLLYGARSPEELLFVRELESWRGRFDLQVLVTVDRADANWRGHVGVVTTLFPQADFEPARAVAMICGPEVMMRFSVRELEKRGVASNRLYVSLERNMQCAMGFCGHCQFGPEFVCMDGPVFRYDQIQQRLHVREL